MRLERKKIHGIDRDDGWYLKITSRTNRIIPLVLQYWRDDSAGSYLSAYYCAWRDVELETEVK